MTRWVDVPQSLVDDGLVIRAGGIGAWSYRAMCRAAGLNDDQIRGVLQRLVKARYAVVSEGRFPFIPEGTGHVYTVSSRGQRWALWWWREGHEKFHARVPWATCRGVYEGRDPILWGIESEVMQHGAS